MSFRKRNVGLSDTRRGADTAAASTPALKEKAQLPGTRPSAIDGRSTTSTGSATLDGLFAGHAGLPLGCSVLIEESGTTDYAGALLRFYAAEGLLQGHHVHVMGLPEQWARELPGAIGEAEKHEKKSFSSSEKMKIAWRYERLGQFGTADNASSRERIPNSPSVPQHDTQSTSSVFCHAFDLTKRLVHPPTAAIDFILIDSHPSRSPFDAALARLASILSSSPPTTVHRVVIPTLLSPALYPPHASVPIHLLRFQHSLRALLSAYNTRLTLIQSLPLSLFPRSTGTTRWLELLSDGVLELAPFPHSSDAEIQSSRDPSTKDEPPQGLLKVHRIPVFHDRGSGHVPSDNDWTFTLSRRKFIIKPFNLPPIEGDTDAQQTASTGNSETKPKKADLEF